MALTKINNNTLSAVTTLPAAIATGKVLQVVSVTKDSTFTTTSTSFVDVTGLSVSITPSSASNKIAVLFNISISNTQGTAATLTRLLRDSTPLSIGASGTGVQATGHAALAADYDQENVSISYLDSPSTTSATTYKVQLKSEHSDYTATLNRGSISSSYGLTASTITVMEVAG
jgi:hypothetical protein